MCINDSVGLVYLLTLKILFSCYCMCVIVSASACVCVHVPCLGGGQKMTELGLSGLQPVGLDALASLHLFFFF